MGLYGVDTKSTPNAFGSRHSVGRTRQGVCRLRHAIEQRRLYRQGGFTIIVDDSASARSRDRALASRNSRTP